MSKHSPAPWTVGATVERVVVFDANKEPVALMQKWEAKKEQSKVDARLIAAAPTMYTVLKEMDHDCGENLYSGTSSCAICHVIAEAEGPK